eukprot:COSAG02_NODE_18066_length_963_cov_1.087963_2_plen_141_part_01
MLRFRSDYEWIRYHPLSHVYITFTLTLLSPPPIYRDFYKVDVSKGEVPRLRDHDTRTLLAGGPAPPPWSKDTLKRFQQSLHLVHRRLDANLLLEQGLEDPDFRDQGGEYQYGWGLCEEAVVAACGIDMDQLRAAKSTKNSG